MKWLALLLLAGCYRGNPPWPGDPTAPPNPIDLPQPPGPTPLGACIHPDSGIRDDAGVWHYKAHTPDGGCP